MKKRNKVRYVFLDYDKFLYDYEFINMKPGDWGIYCTLILFLYSRGGYLELNEKVYHMCNCNMKQFEHAWKTIGTKFKHKRNKIYHEKVLKELEIARSRSQMLTDKGLKGSYARWNKDGQALPEQCTDNANENEKRSELIENENRNRNEQNEKSGIGTSSDERKLDSFWINSASSLSNSARPDPSSAVTLLRRVDENQPSVKKIRIQSRALKFIDYVNKNLHVVTRSDRTGFNNIADFLAKGCVDGSFDIAIFDKAEILVNEARKGDKPNALFMSLAIKELGYRKQSAEEKTKDIVTKTIENFKIV